jgi:hypothetical protein
MPPLYRFNWFITLNRIEHVPRGHGYLVENNLDSILKKSQGVLEEVPAISYLVRQNFKLTESILFEE